MKKIRKVLAIVLVVVMLMMTSVTAFADHRYLQLNERTQIGQNGGGYSMFNFSSEDGGWYVIYTETILDEEVVGYATDPYICINDSDGNYIASADDSMFDNRNCEISFFMVHEIIYIILKLNNVYEKVFEGFTGIPMEDNIGYFRFDSHSDILSNGNN